MFPEINNEETMSLAISNFEIYSIQEPGFLNENEFYEVLDSYFKFHKLQSEVYLFKKDDFFHTFIKSDQNKINFDEFLKLLEDFLIYIKMKSNKNGSNNNYNDFDFDLKFEENDFTGLI